MSRHSGGPGPVPQLCFTRPWRERVVATLEPHLRDPGLIDEAIRETERALGHVLSAQRRGRAGKPERIAPSVRAELKEIVQLGRRLGGVGADASDDARWFLFQTDPLRPPSAPDPVDHPRLDGFDRLAEMSAFLIAWGRQAIAALDVEGQPSLSPGTASRRDLRTGGERLADVWEKFTGKGLSRHNRDGRDDGPFPTYLKTALQTIESTLRGAKLARTIHEARREGRRVDRLQAEKASTTP